MPFVEIDGQKIDVDAMLMDIERTECEDSLYEFLRKGWKYIDPAPFTDGWPIEAVAEHLQAVADGDIKRLIINIPPRCAKSSLTSVAFPAWVWAQPWMTDTSGAGVQFLHASYAQQLSLWDSTKCRRLIESPWYQSLWGSRFTRLPGTRTRDQDPDMKFVVRRQVCCRVCRVLVGERARPGLRPIRVQAVGLDYGGKYVHLERLL